MKGSWMNIQTIRLWDVFFVGPWMLWAAWRLGDPILGVLGMLTILYNGSRYLDEK